MNQRQQRLFESGGESVKRDLFGKSQTIKIPLEQQLREQIDLLQNELACLKNKSAPKLVDKQTQSESKTIDVLNEIIKQKDQSIEQYEKQILSFKNIIVQRNSQIKELLARIEKNDPLRKSQILRISQFTQIDQSEFESQQTQVQNIHKIQQPSKLDSQLQVNVITPQMDQLTQTMSIQLIDKSTQNQQKTLDYCLQNFQIEINQEFSSFMSSKSKKTNESQLIKMESDITQVDLNDFMKSIETQTELEEQEQKSQINSQQSSQKKPKLTLFNLEQFVNKNKCTQTEINSYSEISMLTEDQLYQQTQQLKKIIQEQEIERKKLQDQINILESQLNQQKQQGSNVNMKKQLQNQETQIIATLTNVAETQTNYESFFNQECKIIQVNHVNENICCFSQQTETIQQEVIINKKDIIEQSSQTEQNNKEQLTQTEQQQQQQQQQQQKIQMKNKQIQFKIITQDEYVQTEEILQQVQYMQQDQIEQKQAQIDLIKANEVNTQLKKQMTTIQIELKSVQAQYNQVLNDYYYLQSESKANEKQIKALTDEVEQLRQELSLSSAETVTSPKDSQRSFGIQKKSKPFILNKSNSNYYNTKNIDEAILLKEENQRLQIKISDLKSQVFEGQKTLKQLQDDAVNKDQQLNDLCVESGKSQKELKEMKSRIELVEELEQKLQDMDIKYKSEITTLNQKLSSLNSDYQGLKLINVSLHTQLEKYQKKHQQQ